jgi:hypothetical protein
LTIQNEPGKKILKHKIQQAIKEKAESLNNWCDDWGTDWDRTWDDEPPWD